MSADGIGDGQDIMDAIAQELGPSDDSVRGERGTMGEGAGNANGSGPGPGPESDSGPYSHLRDSHGRKFDPRIHCVNPDGSPRINPKSGHLRVKKGMTGEQGGYVPPEPQIGNEYRSMGIAVNRTFVMCCIMMGCDPWRPSETELEALDGAWGNYFAARGIMNVPPEVMLAAALLGYAGPRLQASPSLRSKVAAWWAKRRNATPNPNGNGATSGDASQSDNRDDS